MKPQLTIITPCTRTGNLPQIAESIQPGRVLFDLTWRVVLDGAKVDPQPLPPGISVLFASHELSIYGNHQRNVGIDYTKDGWLYFLDDDNLVHPDLFRYLASWIKTYPLASGFAFHQILRKRTRIACPDNMKVRSIDMAQVVIHHALVKEVRFNLGIYEADGVFIQSIYEREPGAWVFPNVAACYYNKLR